MLSGGREVVMMEGDSGMVREDVCTDVGVVMEDVGEEEQDRGSWEDDCLQRVFQCLRMS